MDLRAFDVWSYNLWVSAGLARIRQLCQLSLMQAAQCQRTSGAAEMHVSKRGSNQG